MSVPPATQGQPSGSGLAPRHVSRFPRLADTSEQLRNVWTHPANRNHRLAAVGRVVRFQIDGRVLKRRTIKPIGDHARMWCDIHQFASRKLVIGNPPDWDEMQSWRSLLDPGDLVVDVGGNIGVYAIWLADLGMQVVSIEPHPSSRRLLEENLALNHLDVTVVGCALSSTPGTMRLTANRQTMNHLIVDAGEAEETATIEVEVRTLDDVIGDRVAGGVKIDVEGAERMVLEGASKALSEGRIAALQLEWNDECERLLGESRAPIVELLSGYGFSFFRPDHEGRLRPLHGSVPYGSDVFALSDAAAERATS